MLLPQSAYETARERGESVSKCRETSETHIKMVTKTLAFSSPQRTLLLSVEPWQCADCRRVRSLQPHVQKRTVSSTHVHSLFAGSLLPRFQGLRPNEPQAGYSEEVNDLLRRQSPTGKWLG